MEYTRKKHVEAIRLIERLYDSFTMGNWLYYLLGCSILLGFPISLFFDGYEQAIYITEIALKSALFLAILFGLVCMWACVYHAELDKFHPGSLKTLSGMDYDSKEKRTAILKATAVVIIIVAGLIFF